MKKILTQTALFTIGALISIPMNFLILRDWIHSFTIAISISIAFLIVNLLTKYVTITNIKKLYKRLWIFIRYKRVKEINLSCRGCVFTDNNKCKHREYNFVQKCFDTNTIFVKRNYNIFKWIKKLFILCVIAILSVSCVTINVYENKPTNYKKEAEKLEQKENIWY